jgi:curved DNA-binding protein CbpA
MKIKVTVKPVPAAELSQAMPALTKVNPSPDHDDWETRDHLNTLSKAHEILSDPVKLAKVHKLAGRHVKAIKSLSDIKAYNQQQHGGPGGQAKESLEEGESY